MPSTGVTMGSDTYHIAYTDGWGRRGSYFRCGRRCRASASSTRRGSSASRRTWVKRARSSSMRPRPPTASGPAPSLPGILPETICVSVGLEDAGDLVADLNQAFAAAFSRPTRGPRECGTTGTAPATPNGPDRHARHEKPPGPIRRLYDGGGKWPETLFGGCERLTYTLKEPRNPLAE